MKFKILIYLFLVFSIPSMCTAELIGHWVFNDDHIRGKEIKDRQGNFDGKIIGGAKFSKAANALLLYGRDNYIEVQRKISFAELPKKSLRLKHMLR